MVKEFLQLKKMILLKKYQMDMCTILVVTIRTILRMAKLYGNNFKKIEESFKNIEGKKNRNR